MRKLNWVAYASLAFLVLLTGFPFLWMIITSIKHTQVLGDLNHMFWPAKPTLENYAALFNSQKFLFWFRNSVIVATVSTVIASVSGALSGYALARVQFPGRSALSVAVLAAYLIPPTILFIPLYRIIQAMGLSNSLTGLIVAYQTFTVPLATWLLVGFFRSIPRELEQAAWIDGASRWQTLTQVVLPLAKPGLVAAGLFAFTNSWNEFLYALVFITDAKSHTLTVGLTNMITGDVYLWGQLMAAAVIAGIPVIAMYIYLQKYVVAGLTAGAVKG